MVEINIIDTTIHNRNQTDQNFHLKPVPIHTPGVETIPMIPQEILRTIEIEIIPSIGIETTQIFEIKDIKTKDHEIVLTTDQIITDLITTTAIQKLQPPSNKKKSKEFSEC